MNKEIENIVGANLQKMKDIMNKKIMINDYVYELSNDEATKSKTKQKFSKSS